MTCGCDSRKDILTQGDWKADATVVAALVVTLTIIHGGSMSTKTKKMVTIAFVGAVVAVLADGIIKPRVGMGQ